MYLTCVIRTNTMTIKHRSRRASSSCLIRKENLRHYDVVPSRPINLICKKTDECYSAFASIMVWNKTSSKIEALRVVVACLSRTKCQGKKNIKKTHHIVSTKNQTITNTSITCLKPEDDIFAMVLTFNATYGSWAYEKVIYDCRCQCSGQ